MDIAKEARYKMNDTEVHDSSDASKTSEMLENLQEKSKDDLTSEAGTSNADISAESSLSHQDAMRKVQNAIGNMITRDPLLYDLPPQVTVEEINSCIALEHGQAMIVNVRRADDEVMAIVVTQDATVLDLKHAIKRHITLKQLRNGGKQHISWRYIWKRFWLYFDGQKLKDDKTKLKDYGIQNKDEITFIKRLTEK